jgi:hypothetical protein
MKKLFLISIIFLLPGCAPITASSTKYNQADFTKFKTYSWGENRLTIEDAGKSVNEFSEQVSEMARRDIQPITDAVLQSKGFELATDGKPDFIVLYIARGRAQNSLPRKSNTSNIADEIGTYLVGSITIYIYESPGKKVLWQGIGQTPVTGQGTDNSRLKKTIEKMFDGFPSKK